MHLFYAPDIAPPRHTLAPEESRHCVRVLRMRPGDAVHLTDGRGNLFEGAVAATDEKRCEIAITGVTPEYGRRPYRLTMAVAPTRNPERYDWFLEKATEVGCDMFIPVASAHVERHRFNAERGERIITGAMKQSLKAYRPGLQKITPFADIIKMPFAGRRLIAHCNEPIWESKLLRDVIAPGDDVLVLIGPEGDFSPAEVRMAVERGFAEVSLGRERLRTETAALAAAVTVAVINQ